MKKVFLMGALAVCPLLIAQDAADRITVPFSDPSRPRSLKASLVNGSITVRGYEGKDVLIESSGAGTTRHNRKAENEGLHRIGMSSGLTVEEQDNVVRVTAFPAGSPHLIIQVPRQISINLRVVNGGFIEVDGVEGEVDADVVNGPLRVLNVSGAVVAHSLNGEVKVTMDRLQGNKPMAFSSLNGDVDVTLPADVKARVKMKSDHGEMYTDFDVKLEANGRALVEDSRHSSGKYRVQMDRSLVGTINGGGPDLSFTTLNGRIYIRKKK
jgi:hypothetical protein